MIRLCVFLVWNALVCAVSLIFEGARVWLLVKPWKRLRQWRMRRKQLKSWTEEHGGPPDEILEDFHPKPDEDVMNEQALSFVRGALKFAAGFLVAKGVFDAGDAAALQVAIEALVGGVMGLWAFWASHKKHA